MSKATVIGYWRTVNIQVISNNNELLFEGMVDDAPEEIKELEYVKSDMGGQLKFYV